MKFYRDKDYYNFITNNKLTAIYCSDVATSFLLNGMLHNSKNATYVNNIEDSLFFLNGKFYGTKKDFNKELWRKFAKFKVLI